MVELGIAGADRPIPPGDYPSTWARGKHIRSAPAPTVLSILETRRSVSTIMRPTEAGPSFRVLSSASSRSWRRKILLGRG